MQNKITALKDLDNLPTPKGVGIQIMKLMQNENFNLQDLADLLKLDPVLSAKVIQFANMPIHKKNNKAILDIHEAIKTIGLNVALQIALSFSIIHNISPNNMRFDYNYYWKSSLFQALTLKKIAQHLKLGKAEEYFICGLLANIGLLSLIETYNAEYDDIFTILSLEDNLEILKKEKELLGLNHKEVSALLFRDWGMPEHFITSLEEEVYPVDGDTLDAHKKIALSIQLSFLAGHYYCSTKKRESILASLLGIAKMLGVDNAKIIEFGKEVEKEWIELAKIYEIDAHIDEYNKDIWDIDRTFKNINVYSPIKYQTFFNTDFNFYEIKESVQLTEPLLNAKRVELVILDITADTKTEVITALTLIRSSESLKNLYIIGMGKKLEQKEYYEYLNAGLDEYFYDTLTLEEIQLRLKSVKRVIGLQNGIKKEKAHAEKHIRELEIINRKLEKANSIDNLTGLPNRLSFTKRIEEIVARKDTYKNMAILFIDLDGFKNVNDTYGHDFGDELLLAISERIKKCVGGMPLYRMGGDEFSIVATNYQSQSQIEKISQLLLEKIAQPYQIDKHSIRISSSIGICTYPENSMDVHSLIKYADIAMFEAKRNGKDQIVWYTESMSEQTKLRMQLENELKKTLANDEFELHFQPQVSLKNKNKIEGFEALIRWNHPTMGYIPPTKFIPIAEETGVIVDIGEWVLKKALTQIKEWRQFLPHVKVAVNLSAKQFNEKDLVSKVVNMLAQLDLPGSALELEITEGTLIENIDYTISVLKELNTHNITISLDDFGTGYSSLMYLKKLPIDIIKIDRSFIMDIPNDKDDIEITKLICNLSKGLNKKVIAEGIETQEQWDFLKAQGCEYGQGYFFYKPLPAKTINGLFEKMKQAKNKTYCK